jgi:hypothetical protein
MPTASFKRSCAQTPRRAVEHEDPAAAIAQDEAMGDLLLGGEVQARQICEPASSQRLQLHARLRVERETAFRELWKTAERRGGGEHGQGEGHSTILSGSSSRSVQNLGTSFHSPFHRGVNCAGTSRS